ncbi:MAG: repeat-associated core domain protein [Acidobacteria bacterium]|nr:repeat-associated core domain protein [Acidobacteriota bacterium]
MAFSSCAHNASSFRQLIALLLIALMTLLLAPPTLASAAAKDIAEKLMNTAQSTRLRLEGFVAALKGNQENPNSQNRGMPEAPPSSTSASPRRAHTKVEREGKVSRLELNTKDNVELRSGQHMLFAAIPFDVEGSAIHGLAADWESTDPQVVTISRKGEAVAGVPGVAHITATAGAKNEKVKITVGPPIASPAEATETGKEIKTNRARRTAPNADAAHVSKTSSGSAESIRRFRQYAHRRTLTASGTPQGQGRDPDAFYSARNSVGTPPNKTTPGAQSRAAATEGTEAPGSSNFSFSVPIVNLPGRGLNIDLSAFYNSRIWNRADYLHTTISYDVDQGWPAPGFTLGYGHLRWQGTVSRSWELADSDGTRHQLLDPSAYPGTQTYTYDSADGTSIHLIANAGTPPTPTTATYADGTQVLFGAQNSQTLIYYPIQITDRNGNQILISYVGGSGPRISSIQDTMGRYVNFKYVGNDLVAITAPGLTGQADRPVIRFYYQDVTGLNQSGLFQSGTSVNAPLNGTAHVIKYIYLANSVETNDAHIGYRYDYSAYGMIYQIAKVQGMTINTAANDYTQAGAVNSEGTQAALTTYSYPTTPSNLSDAPTYTTRTDDWAGRVSAQPVYTFSANPETGISIVTAPPPDNTVTETHTVVDPGQEDDGLISEIAIKQGTNVLSDTVNSWELGTGSVMRLHQVQISNDAPAGDPKKTRTIVYEYDSGSPYNNVWKVHEYGFAPAGTLGPELRRTETTYLNQASYWNRGLVNLPASVKVWDVVRNILASQTAYSYDEPAHLNLNALSGIIQYTDPSSIVRGDLTTVTQYADTSDPNSPSGPISHSTNYDTAGNVTSATADCCQLKTFSYSSGNYYAYQTAVTSGSGPTLTNSATYDFNSGLVTSTTDENNQTTANSFTVDSLRISSVLRPDGSTTYYYYSEYLQGNGLTNGLHYFTETATQLDATRYVYSYKFYDGRGAVTQTFDNYAYQPQLSASKWSAQAIEYDVMGRAYRFGNPYHTGGYGWSPINPGGLWTTSTFDNLGRLTQTTMPSGDNPASPTIATFSTSYSGNRTLVKDSAGKERLSQTNELGQVTDVWEVTAADSATEAVTFPGFSEVTAGYHTNYKFDVLDNLAQVTQAIPNSVTQNRYFKFDSIGRLKYERQVEQGAPYTATDSLTGNNSWSRSYTYNSQGKIIDAGDARSIHTTFNYDGLNRVSTVTYSDGTTPALAYIYDQARSPYLNAGRLTTMSTAALGAAPSTATEYDYDLLGHVAAHRQKVGATTYSMGYTYNLAGELLSETYPSLRTMNYAYDEAGRLASFSDNNNVTYANTFSYAPHGGLLSENFGNTAIHSMTYNNAFQPNKIALSLGGSEQQRYNYSYGQVNQTDGSVDTTKNNGQIGRIDGYISNTKQWDQRFSYDPLARLTDAAEYRGDNAAQIYKAHYDYDRFGNRFQYQNNVNLNYVTLQPSDINQATNRFISTGGTPVTYDNNVTNGPGNVTNDGKFRGLSYGYDGNSRQTSASGIGVSQTAVYDCAGQRVQTTANSVTRSMVYDIFGQDIADYLGSTLERENIYRGGQLLATQEFNTRSNVALAANGGVASASSYFSNPNYGTYLPSYVNDGLRRALNGAIWVDNNQYTFPDWIEVDFNGSKTLDEIDVVTQQDDNLNPVEPTLTQTFSTWGITAFDVQYWNGSSWLTVPGGSVTGNNKVWRQFSFSSITTSKVRVLVNDCADHVYSRIVEVEAYGTPATGAGAVNYVLQDLQGSTRAVMNNNGSSSTIVARHDYLPFGEEIGSGTGMRSNGQFYGATDKNRRKFATTERDDTTGLDHTWFRKYESLSGRWTSPDPYLGSMTPDNPQSFNRYSYTGNDPVNLIDPTGLFCIEYDTFINTGGWATLTHHRDCFLKTGDYGGFDGSHPFSPVGRGPGGGIGAGGGGRPGGGGRQPQNPVPKDPSDAKRDLNAWMATHLKDCLDEATANHRRVQNGINEWARDAIIGIPSIGGNITAGLLARLAGQTALRSISASGSGFGLTLMMVSSYGLGQTLGNDRAFARAQANCRSVYRQR